MAACLSIVCPHAEARSGPYISFFNQDPSTIASDLIAEIVTGLTQSRAFASAGANSHGALLENGPKRILTNYRFGLLGLRIALYHSL
ncbi:hypothetical protein BT63DRAFT_424137, partial [Microthyrium microscopicum]